MSFGIVPGSFVVGTGGAPLSVSRPNALRLAVFDSGSGGQMLLTGLGAAVAAAVGGTDIAAMVTSNGGQFQSNALLTAFRRYAGLTSVGFAEEALAGLDIFSAPWNAAVVSSGPAWRATFNPAAPNCPVLQINGPAVAGTWYLTISVRGAIGD
jgi:hypothetical protein